MANDYQYDVFVSYSNSPDVRARSRQFPRTHKQRWLLLPWLVILLQACSAGSGGGASERELDLTADLGGAGFVYNGPSPASEEVQGFKVSFYDPLSASKHRSNVLHGSDDLIGILRGEADWPGIDSSKLTK